MKFKIDIFFWKYLNSFFYKIISIRYIIEWIIYILIKRSFIALKKKIISILEFIKIKK